MSLRLKPIVDEEAEATNPSTNVTAKKQVCDLGNGSEIVYISRFVSSDQGWTWFDYLDKQIPWSRPVIRVFGRSVAQPRDSCYVASSGLPELTYSGYRPHPFSWDDFPPLRDILDAVHKVLPGSSFNSLLLNRYKCGSDYVAWHSDDEKLYGLNHDIASLSFGCEREFLLRSKHKTFQETRKEEETASKRSKKSSQYCQHSFMLKHGSLLVMKGFTQRDWIHSIPKRAKAESTRINLTFRRVVRFHGKRGKINVNGVEESEEIFVSVDSKPAFILRSEKLIPIPNVDFTDFPIMVPCHDGPAEQLHVWRNCKVVDEMDEVQNEVLKKLSKPISLLL